MEAVVNAGVWLVLFTNFVCLALIIFLFRNFSSKKPQTTELPRNQSPAEPSSPLKPDENTPTVSRKVSISDSLRVYNAEPRVIKRICITGGPCAGKTTALTKISERLSEHGIKTYIVPEAATLLMRGGAMINMHDFTRTQKMKFQMNLLRLQMNLEDIFNDIAYSNCKLGEISVILCDRGVMDGSAYIEPELWQAMLDETGWSEVHLRDARYEAVIHMVTAADGAEEHYNSLTNEARYEDMENARQIDKLVLEAWTGHPYLRIIDNQVRSFDEKLHKSVEAVCKYCDLAAPVMSFYKFLVKGEKLPVHFQEISLEETFLTCNPKVTDRITKRGHEGSFTYVHTITHKETKKTVVRCR
jgi:thymidylate kinase